MTGKRLYIVRDLKIGILLRRNEKVQTDVDMWNARTMPIEGAGWGPWVGDSGGGVKCKAL